MKSHKCGTSSASRLPTASSGLQQKHGTGGSGLGPVKEPPLAGNFGVSLAPATSPRCYSKPATMATTDGSKAKNGRTLWQGRNVAIAMRRRRPTLWRIEKEEGFSFKPSRLRGGPSWWRGSFVAANRVDGLAPAALHQARCHSGFPIRASGEGCRAPLPGLHWRCSKSQTFRLRRYAW